MHDDYLAPHAQPVKSALSRLVDDVNAKKNELDPEVPESVAKTMRIELQQR